MIFYRYSDAEIHTPKCMAFIDDNAELKEVVQIELLDIAKSYDLIDSHDVNITKKHLLKMNQY